MAVEWISVADCLPEDGQCCQVCANYLKEYSAIWLARYRHLDGIATWTSFENLNEIEDLNVTHWAPILDCPVGAWDHDLPDIQGGVRVDHELFERHVYVWDRMSPDDRITSDPAWWVVGGLRSWDASVGDEVLCNGTRLRRVLWCLSGPRGIAECVAVTPSGQVVVDDEKKQPVTIFHHGHIAVSRPSRQLKDRFIWSDAIEQATRP